MRSSIAAKLPNNVRSLSALSLRVFPFQVRFRHNFVEGGAQKTLFHSQRRTAALPKASDMYTRRTPAKYVQTFLQ